MNKVRLLTTTLLPALQAQAIEVAPGDYEQFPVGATIGIIYYQHSTTDSAYANGHKVSSDFKLSSDVGILRLLHVYALTDTVTIDPQLLLPFGHFQRRRCFNAWQYEWDWRPNAGSPGQVKTQRRP